MYCLCIAFARLFIAKHLVVEQIIGVADIVCAGISHHRHLFVDGIIEKVGVHLLASFHHTVGVVDGKFAQFHEVEFLAVVVENRFLGVFEFYAVFEVVAQLSLQFLTENLCYHLAVGD